MPTLFRCSKCGCAMSTDLASGARETCPDCGTEVVVPAMSEAKRVESVATEAVEWRRLRLIALVPAACLYLAMAIAFAFHAAGLPFLLLATAVGTGLVGLWTGRAVRRSRFLRGLGVAIAGSFLGAVLFVAGTPIFMSLDPNTREGDAAGWLIVAAWMFLAGVIASPLAGIIAALAGRNRPGDARRA